MTKHRLCVNLTAPIAEQLELAAKRPGASKSTIIHAALDRFLSVDRDLEAGATIVRRLDRVGRQLDRIERDLSIIIETIGLHVRYHLSVTPRVADSEQEAARALGRDRFELFVAQVGRRLASGGRLIAEVLDRASSTRSDAVARGIETGLEQTSKLEDKAPLHDAVGEQPERSPAGREGVGHV
jgi:metal-responsive CopG/Arc/MetJ family transcriptional regulator